MISRPILVLCTAPNDRLGATLARGLVEAKLAACVNVIPGLRSFYFWEGEVQDDAEVQLLIKTRLDRYEAVERWLKANHPADVPEILALPIEHGSKDYLRWLTEQSSSGEAP